MKQLLWIVLLLVICNQGYSQTKIKQSKNDVNQSDNNTVQPKSIKVYEVEREEETYKPFKEFLTASILNVAWLVTFSSAVGIYSIENHLYNDLSLYPYAEGYEGNYISYDSISETTNRFRLDIDNHLLYSHKHLYGNHLKVKVRPFQYFYIQTDYHQLAEYDKIASKQDHLSLFHFNFNYDRLRFDKVNLGWTLGMNYIANEAQKVGFNLGTDVSVFPGKNISFYGSAKWSWINGSHVNVYELDLNYHLKKYFISLGHEHLKIGTPHYNFFTIGGGIYLP